jgi:hypothetical protein
MNIQNYETQYWQMVLRSKHFHDMQLAFALSS